MQNCCSSHVFKRIYQADIKSVCCWDLQREGLQSTYYVITFSQIFDPPLLNPPPPPSASCLNQNIVSRTRMLLLGIVSVLYCCFIQCIWLESGLIRNLFTFPDFTFSFQFSYCFCIFCCIMFNFFSQFLFSFKLQLLFRVKICVLVRIK